MALTRLPSQKRKNYLRFLYDGGYDEFRTKLTQLGQTPLPKYINREVEPDDKERYQTIFAKNEGAVAAPTAGMHFSKHLLKRLEIKGINFHMSLPWQRKSKSKTSAICLSTRISVRTLALTNSLSVLLIFS